MKGWKIIGLAMVLVVGVLFSGCIESSDDDEDDDRPYILSVDMELITDGGSPPEEVEELKITPRKENIDWADYLVNIDGAMISAADMTAAGTTIVGVSEVFDIDEETVEPLVVGNSYNVKIISIDDQRVVADEEVVVYLMDRSYILSVDMELTTDGVTPPGEAEEIVITPLKGTIEWAEYKILIDGTEISATDMTAAGTTASGIEEVFDIDEETAEPLVVGNSYNVKIVRIDINKVVVESEVTCLMA